MQMAITPHIGIGVVKQALILDYVQVVLELKLNMSVQVIFGLIQL